MTVRTIIAVLVLAIAATAQKQGRLEDDETWSGQVEVTGDVEVPAGKVLTILPGTTVAIAATDGRAAGWDPKRIEIHVHGTLYMRGTPEQPVTFAVGGRLAAAVERPTATVVESAEQASWHGIVLHGGTKAPRHEVHMAQFAGAFAALQVPVGDPQIADCTFLRCAVGVEVGSAYRDDRNWGIDPGASQPDILRCRFAGCDTGVFVEGKGCPDVRRTVFYRCRVGLGCRRPGYTRRLEEPGAVLSRCAVLDNEIGVVAPALVHDSILAWNETAVTLSSFHSPFSVAIDHVAMRDNLFFENTRFVDGETGLDHEPVLGDPKFLGAIAELGNPGIPVPPCLALASDSPARGAAGDGGDLGPSGARGAVVNGVLWKSQGDALDHLLALPFDSKADRRRSFKTAAAGQGVGRRWWAVAPSNAGNVDLRSTFGSDRTGWLAVPVVGAESGAQVEINGDLEDYELFCNGKRVGGDDVRRRFGETGVVLSLPPTAEEALVVVRVRGWGLQPRFGMALRGCRRVPGPVVAAEGLTIKSCRLTKQRRTKVLLFTVAGGDLNWSDAERQGCLLVTGLDERELHGTDSLLPEFTGPRKFRVELPADWDKPLSVVLRGLRNPQGATYPDTERFELR